MGKRALCRSARREARLPSRSKLAAYRKDSGDRAVGAAVLRHILAHVARAISRQFSQPNRGTKPAVQNGMSRFARWLLALAATCVVPLPIACGADSAPVAAGNAGSGSNNALGGAGGGGAGGGGMGGTGILGQSGADTKGGCPIDSTFCMGNALYRCARFQSPTVTECGSNSYCDGLQCVPIPQDAGPAGLDAGEDAGADSGTSSVRDSGPENPVTTADGG